jgi:lipid A ethanolaminephosphotransferase
MAQAAGMMPLQNAVSCATNTIAAVSCMLSHQGAQTPAVSHFEPLPSYLNRNGVETIVRLNNTGTPPLAVTQLQWGDEVLAGCTENCPNPAMDEALLWQLAPRIAAAKSNRVFVILHFTASHGPTYFKKYPPAFERFAPVCTSVQLADCTPQELLNAYDNTILYTDALLGDLVAQLKTLENTRSAVLYLSDHGESLGEAGMYLHGAPNAIAPAVQREIPFMVWMSDAFQTAYRPPPLPTEATIGGGTADDLPFHSIMGAFGMTSPIYKPQFDLFAGQKPIK